MACDTTKLGTDVCFSTMGGLSLTGTIASSVTISTGGTEKKIPGADGNTTTVILFDSWETVSFEAILLTSNPPALVWGDTTAFTGSNTVYRITKADYIYKAGDECRISIDAIKECGITYT